MKKTIPRSKYVRAAMVSIIVTILLASPGVVLAGLPTNPQRPILEDPSWSDRPEMSPPARTFTHNIIPRSHSSYKIPSPIKVDIDIIELIQQLNESLMLRYLENLTAFGPRVTGTEACDQAAVYIYNEFKNMGLPVRYQNWTDNSLSGSNVEATLLGTDPTNIFIVCGHYDSVTGSPGADDDGSGVAAALAAAYIMKQYTFTYTVRFVAFSGEEQGLIGSGYYVEEAYNHGDSIIAALNADMIGYTAIGTDGKKGKIYLNDASEWIVNFTMDISQLYNDYINIQLIPSGSSGGSDHYRFWEYGYDAIFYAEYHFNDYYHSPDDTIEHMNLTYTARYSRLILATLAEMAQQPRPVLEITNITGGLGVTAAITNSGDEDATNVSMTITITGGILGLINTSATGTLSLLPPQGILQEKARVFRLGSITIVVTAVASNADQVTKEATAFVLGPFVLRVTSI